MQAGQILQNRYQLQWQLGGRPHRQTWLAEDVQTQTQVVVKVLTAIESSTWADLKLFEREARVLQALSHPQIPKYLDFFELEKQAFGVGLVETYIPGRSLIDRLRQGERFRDPEIYNIAIQVLEILVDLHELNPPILHRDIKPSNLIWGEDGLLYLVDFGAVQERGTPPGESFTIVGTYGYTPIEQFGGQAVPASDLYALGATLIHLLTGIAPADLPQENLRIQFRSSTSASSALISWLEKLTDPSVQRRFQSARQALAALQTPSLGQQIEQLVNQISAKPAIVQLEQSPDHLTLTIPARWQNPIPTSLPFLTPIGAVSASVILAALTEGQFLWAVILAGMVFGGIGASILQTTIAPLTESFFLELDRTCFEIKRLRSGKVINRAQGKLEDIEVFSVTRASAYQGAIVIRTRQGQYRLEGNLTESEARWAVRRIQGWLGDG